VWLRCESSFRNMPPERFTWSPNCAEATDLRYSTFTTCTHCDVQDRVATQNPMPTAAGTSLTPRLSAGRRRSKAVASGRSRAHPRSAHGVLVKGTITVLSRRRPKADPACRTAASRTTASSLPLTPNGSAPLGRWSVDLVIHRRHLYRGLGEGKPECSAAQSSHFFQHRALLSELF
jgi:hypothetical protein